MSRSVASTTRTIRSGFTDDAEDPLEFPTAEEIAAAKKIARACKHRVVRRSPGEDRCLQCGAYRLFNSKWMAPLRTPKIRRIK